MADIQESIPQKSKRRWRYVLLVFLLLILIGGGILWGMHARSVGKLEAKLAEIRAAGYPVTPEELDQWYPQVPDDKNAALVLKNAFQYYVSLDKDMEYLPVCGIAETPIRNEPLSLKMKASIRNYLELNKRAFPFLHEGAALPESRFPIDLSQGINVLLTHLGNVRKGAKLLYLDALQNAVEGRSEPASRDIVTMAGVAGSLSKEPILISQLVRIACLSLICESTEQILNRTTFTDSELTKMATVLESAVKNDGLFRALIGERCTGYEFYRHPEAFNTSSRDGSSFSTPTTIDLKFFKRIIGRSSEIIGVSFYKNSGMLVDDYCSYLDYMSEYINVYRSPLPGRIKNACEIERKMRSVRSGIMKYFPLRLFFVLIPAFPRAFIFDARCQASLDATRTAMAIERYRLAKEMLPDSLKELVPAYLKTIPIDPFDPDGKTLRYAKLKKGYVVYSIGEDGKDNSGTEKDAKGKRYSEGTDVTFIVER
jgi:hypothetical protein